MRQALHIFKKDVRYLTYEIVVTLMLVAMFAWADSRPSVMITHTSWPATLRIFVPLAWWVLIIRVIHAEALPGHQQFWLTRPYSWKSLLAAKALFILAFVTLPMLVADAVIVTAQGFPITSYVPGLLWEQVLRLIFIALPAVVFAALTEGLATLGLAVLAVAAALYLLSMLPDRAPMLWGGLIWIPNSIAITAMAAAALSMVIHQYARRRVVVSLLIAAGVFLIPNLLIPSEAPAALLPSGSFQVSLDAARKFSETAYLRPGEVQVELPIQIAGIPDGRYVVSDAVSVRIEAPGGVNWMTDGGHPGHWAHLEGGGSKFWVVILLDGKLFDRIKNQPAKLRTSLFLTLFGNQRKLTTFRQPQLIPAEVPAPGVGFCEALPSWSVVLQCRMPFRTPGFQLLGYEGAKGFGASNANYEPFPAELGISPISVISLSSPSGFHAKSGLTIFTGEPIRHFRQDFDLKEIRLADYAVSTPGN